MSRDDARHAFSHAEPSLATAVGVKLVVAPMRQATLAKLAADHARVFAVHFPFPGIGKVVAEDQGLVWKPEER